MGCPRWLRRLLRSSLIGPWRRTLFQPALLQFEPVLHVSGRLHVVAEQSFPEEFPNPRRAHSVDLSKRFGNTLHSTVELRHPAAVVAHVAGGNRLRRQQGNQTT